MLDIAGQQEARKPCQAAGFLTSLDFLELSYGAEGRNRTDMRLLPRDFESRASTSFTTSAIKAKT